MLLMMPLQHNPGNRNKLQFNPPLFVYLLQKHMEKAEDKKQKKET